jgi:hypothetical protein
MTGSKYKVAHKRVNKENWSADTAKQKREIIKILKDMIAEIETQPEPESEAPAEAGKAKPQKKSKQTQLVFASPSA